MAHKIHIQEAMRLTGKSRRTLYRDMDAGYVSFQRDARNRRYFDVAELIRAYGELQGEDGTPISEPDPPAPPSAAESLAVARQALERVGELVEENQRYREMVVALVEENRQDREYMTNCMELLLGKVDERKLPTPTRAALQHQGDPHGLRTLLHRLSGPTQGEEQ